MKEIGKKIKERRLEKGLSQEDLAEQCKVNLRTIQRIENNETTPRRKTLDLILEVLDFEILDHGKTTINKYLIWSSFLTLLIIVGTFLGWIRRFKMYLDGEKIYTTFTGWKGYTFLNDYHFNNWLLSMASISIGLVVISHSLGLIKNKVKYVLVQLMCLILYFIGFWGWTHRQVLELRPGLFLVAIATILLIISYRKKDKKSGSNK